jgi:ABC-type phosphate transport system substrate-binding protein
MLRKKWIYNPLKKVQLLSMTKRAALIASLLVPLTVMTNPVMASYTAPGVVDPWQTAPWADLRVAGSFVEWPIIQQALNIPFAGGTSTTSPFQAFANPTGTILCQAFNGGSQHGRDSVTTDSELPGEGSNCAQDANVGMSSYVNNLNCLQDPVARDGVCMLANDNGHVLDGIQGLTIFQIQQIYQGFITNWDQIPGGPNLPIYPIARTIGNETRVSLLSFTGLSEDPQEQSAYSAGGVWQNIPRIDSTGDVITAVTNDAPGTLGYVTVGYAGVLSFPIIVLPVSADNTAAIAHPYVPATNQTVTTGAYPMSRFLWLIEGINSTPSSVPYGKQLVTFMQSPAGQAIVADQGFVTLNPPQDVNRDGTIDIADVVKIGLFFNRDAHYSANCDVNGDGKISIADIVSVGLWYGVWIQPVPPNQW